MPVERSAGIIFFRNSPKGRLYLVIRSSNHIPERGEFWDFPKGRLEKGETGLQAAEREAGEEVGINNYKLLPDFKETIRYFTRREGKPVPKFVAMFLAEAKNAKVNLDTRTSATRNPRKAQHSFGVGVKLSWEHDKYEWLPYNEARKRISVGTMKKALESAEKFLQKTHDKI